MGAGSANPDNPFFMKKITAGQTKKYLTRIIFCVKLNYFKAKKSRVILQRFFIY